MAESTVIDWELVKKKYWDISEIVTTIPPITGQKVAKVDDFVVDWSIGLFRVSAVDAITNVATLEPKLRFTDSTLLDPANGSLITSLSMYQPSVATRVMYDKSVTPRTITTDPRYIHRGVEAVSFRCFYGTDISDDGEVISGNFDGSGNFTSNLITLVEVIPGEPRIKRPPVFETTRDLVSEDIVTYVFYDAVGRKVGTQPFLVSESSAIFDYAADTVYITGIELRGDLIDTVDTKLINNPLNTPFQTALLEAWVLYSNGTPVKVPIDGSKCVLQGVRDFNTSIIGYPKQVVLTYYLDPTEPAINAGNGAQRHISAIYKLANKKVDTSFALKLFIVPEWNAGDTRYEYKYYMTSLAGDVDVDVTAFVNAKIDGGLPLPGTNHGNQMNVTLGIDLDTVMPGAYPGHYHTQSLKLTTEIPGTVGFLPWAIDYVGDGNLVYGTKAIMHTTNLGNGELNIGKDYSNFPMFVGGLYTTVTPLYDSSLTMGPGTPTHVVVMYEGSEYEIDLATGWNTNHVMAASFPNFVQGSTAVYKWIIRDGANDYVMGFSPVLVLLDL